MTPTEPAPSRRGSVHDEEQQQLAPSRRGSLYGDDQQPTSSRRGSLYGDDQALTSSRRGSLYGDEQAPPPSRRGSVHDEEQQAPISRRSSVAASSGPQNEDAAPSSRRSSIVNPNEDELLPPQPSPPPPPPSSSAEQKKRTERLHTCESMFSLDQIFSRDLRITGVSKKGSSWRYHIEVLDIRGSLMPFTDTFNSSSTPSSSTLPSPASSSMASLSSIPDVGAAQARSHLPPVVRYSVMRRYNDFRQLHLYLLDHLDPDLLDSLPKFPDGGLFSYFRGDDPKLLQYRKEQLQRFLRALDELDDTKWCRAFRVFLNPEIDELTIIGGSFASTVDADAAASTHSSSMLWAGEGLSRINTTSGYVSLSYVKSPEIRFKKQPSDGRGDWKRRKIARARAEDSGSGDEDGSRDKSKRVKRLDMGQETENPSDTGDEDDDDNSDGEQTRKPYTQLMKLLSLDPPPQQ